jgi:hypothetical protein
LPKEEALAIYIEKLVEPEDKSLKTTSYSIGFQPEFDEKGNCINIPEIDVHEEDNAPSMG